MSLDTNVVNLATRIATELKAHKTLMNGNAADLAALTTTSKGNLVVALNELKGLIDAIPASVTINDAATAGTSTWSSTKIAAAITAAISALTTGAPTAMDTLDELSAALGDDANFAATITTALGNRVSVIATQGLTSQQKQNARDNIDVWSKAEIGAISTDYVATFVAGLV